MRLESIALTDFLSHAATRWQPNGARLTTLCGPNGAGKSALLDGLLFALYDAARARTDDLVRLGATDMAVEVVFTFAGARYRVTRGRTTRSGGRSFLELAVEQADGSWRPLTADSIRETQAAIEALLRLDAATFTTAAFLRQGDADAFISATGGDRKRILGTVLGLDVYTAAEARAREHLRTGEAQTAESRRTIEALEVSIARRPDVEAEAEAAAAAVVTAVVDLAEADIRRSDAEVGLRAIAGRLADADAAADEVRRIDADLVALRDRYRRAGEGRTAAQAAIERARASAEAEVPEHDVGEARARVDAIEAGERSRTARRDRLEADRRALESATHDHSDHVATWRARHGATATLVASLQEQGMALAPVACPKCGTTFPADPSDIAGRLAAARTALEAVGSEPAEPLAIARTRAALLRDEIAFSESAPDPEAMPAARAALAAAERAVGLAAARDVARASLADAEAAFGRAEAELAEVDAAGKALAAARTAAAAREAWGDDLRNQRDELAGALEAAQRALTSGARIHADALGLQGRIAATLEALELDEHARAAATGALAGAEVDLARLRRLVAAFGVTGIPARIIESVLPELTGYAQELLDQLRPGMELSIRAQRAKRDGKGLVEALDLVVRDGAGERALALFSGGERMSVSLALAVGLSRLVARRAGTAIRTLVIDEPDGLDIDARRAFGQALRLLAHHGELERVVLVSHHEDLAEIGDAVYAVRKVDGRSVVDQVA